MNVNSTINTPRKEIEKKINELISIKTTFNKVILSLLQLNSDETRKISTMTQEEFELSYKDMINSTYNGLSDDGKKDFYIKSLQIVMYNQSIDTLNEVLKEEDQTINNYLLFKNQLDTDVYKNFVESLYLNIDDKEHPKIKLLRNNGLEEWANIRQSILGPACPMMPVLINSIVLCLKKETTEETKKQIRTFLEENIGGSGFLKFGGKNAKNGGGKKDDRSILLKCTTSIFAVTTAIIVGAASYSIALSLTVGSFILAAASVGFLNTTSVIPIVWSVATDITGGTYTIVDSAGLGGGSIYKKTDDRININGKNKVVYKTKTGKRFIKLNKQYIAVSSIKKSLK